MDDTAIQMDCSKVFDIIDMCIICVISCDGWMDGWIDGWVDGYRWMTLQSIWIAVKCLISSIGVSCVISCDG